MAQGGYVYILTNAHHTTLYTGVTAFLNARITEHREKHYPRSFTARYNLFKLVYYAFFNRIEAAISEEKRIKGGSRAQKISLIEAMNPQWHDLFDLIQDMD
jgi:putative endonuclease